MRRFSMITLALGLAGCFVVTPQHRDDVLGGTLDAGRDTGGIDAPVTPDGGANVLVDRCGDETADYMVLRDTEPSFIVDTTAMTNRVGTCGSQASGGNDGFIAIEVTAGDLWHFHVLPDPGTAGQDRDPFLYLIQGTGGSCDTRGCEHRSNQCTGSSDEHFAFVAPSDGIWYLGIDDANPGGGVYEVNAFRLQCGDGTDGHGEGCDGSGTCNSSCQEVLSDTRPAEIEANDNEIEANFVEIDTTLNVVTLTGTIGGDSCTYPDVYNFRIPTEGSSLSVAILQTDGTLCDSGSLTPFDIVLRTSAGEVRQGAMTDPVSGCSELEVSGLSAAAYFIYLEHATAIDDRLVPYQLRITITPP